MSPRLVYGQSERVSAWVAERAGASRLDRAAAIGVAGEDGELIAGVAATEYWPGVDLITHIAAEPGSRWATRGVLRALFAYPFLQLRLPRITAEIRESNELSLKLCGQLGFRREGFKRRAAPGGEGLWILGMLRQECRWLKGAE